MISHLFRFNAVEVKKRLFRQNSLWFLRDLCNANFVNEEGAGFLVKYLSFCRKN